MSGLGAVKPFEGWRVPELKGVEKGTYCISVLTKKLFVMEDEDKNLFSRLFKVQISDG